MTERFLNPSESLALLEKVIQTGMTHEFDERMNRIEFFLENEKVATFRLPITLSYGAELPLKQHELIQYVLVLIRSGTAAVGYFDNGENIDHKVFRAYMVRKKQGKSQVKYLKTKGKSRAGSRVRLAETMSFFENINERLNDYFHQFRVDKIGLSCSETLIPYFFGSKIKAPFEKKDPRLFRIPKHIPNPTYEHLLETNRFLRMGHLKWQRVGNSLIETLLNSPPSTDMVSEEDDW
ncbi:hypothetical protein [Pararhodonellum marinum]|uniref:hypothetical protein n=1 Tax=Pararhodonellum marinum TaxID=2755358 RepID=UPI001890698C|nr:hypothetical protein [Pararhodonellum marinum]